MTQETWSAVDHYFESSLLPADPVLAAALKASDDAGLPHIAVSATQGKLLQLLAQMQGARRILEVGTLGGYSTICLARALPSNGHLTTLELDPKHAAVARRNLDHAGFSPLTKVIEGPARESLESLPDSDPFDFVFIDADKPNNPHYFTEALRLTRPGATIIVDNVVRNGDIINPTADKSRVQGTHDLLKLLKDNPKVTASAIQTVGTKGYDGFLLARVLP